MGVSDDTRGVELTVKGKAPRMGASRRARWRAGVLIAVHVVMVAHLIQWLVVGMTVSPIEPSESMETLEFGAVNAGAVVFLIGLVTTLVFGRFFCGWVCHVVALQDLCAWVMVKCGVRPKPFRSRLLVWVPLLLALYMFVWPSFKRWVMAPGFDAMGWEWPVVFGAVPGAVDVHAAFLVEDFWATFPEWYIAIPFLIVIGFGAVYFLGAKGFCTYGCPYGGFFAPIDKVAPVRIVVSDACGQCGYCTSVCTSNVRVHEEVRDYGMVIDQGCMKTMDCVASCPNGALSLGFGGPAVGKKPRNPETAKDAAAKRERRYDVSRRAEWGLALWFAFVFFATRGALDQVPMLMAAGIAGIAAAGGLLALRVVTKKDVRLQGLVLKRGGRVTWKGAGLVASVVVFAGACVWTGQANYWRYRAGLVYDSLDVPAVFVLRAEYMTDPETEARARRGIEMYERADAVALGGWGWRLNADERVELAYMRTLVRDYAGAVEELTRAIEDGNPTGSLVIRRGQLMIKDGAPMTALGENNASALALHPDLHLMRSELAKQAASQGDMETAESYWEAAPEEDELGWTLAQASYAGFIGDAERARGLLEDARGLAEKRAARAERLLEVASSALGIRMMDVAAGCADAAVEDGRATGRVWMAAAEIAATSGDMDTALARVDEALSTGAGSDAEVLRRAAVVHARARDGERAGALLRAALGEVRTDLARRSIGEWMVRVGAQFGDEGLLEEGLGVWGSVVEARADLPVLGLDFAGFLVRLGRAEEAAAAAERAGMHDDRNAMIANRVGDVFAQLGDPDATQRWIEIAAAREAAWAADEGSGSAP